ncbi:MAG: hypothetical protein ACRC62_24435 [Microcoleus sp.]
MITASPGWKPRRLPNRDLKSPISAEEKAKLKAESQARWQRCRPIFERVRDELMATHYNWYIVIDPDSGEYFIEKEQLTAFQKLLANPPQKLMVVRRLNETGVCGSIL